MDELLSGSKQPRTFSEEQLKAKLSMCAVTGQASFAFACAARLLPSFYKWHEDVSMQDKKEVGEVFQQIFSQIKEGNVLFDKEILLQQADDLLEYMPNEGSPWSKMRPIAEDAIASLSYAIRCLAMSDPQEAVWAARRSYEAADQLAIFEISGESGPLPSEITLLSHPIVQAELERQARDLGLVLDAKSSLVLDFAHTESVLVP